jgi:glycosyltransferase involved in cell wall biosynthesis
MGKVSIVIPTFNQVKHLATCVDHCLFQTYPKIEIIIVDGGSTDGTKDYLKNLRATIETQTCNPIIKMDRGGNIIRQKILSYPKNRDLKIITFSEDIGATRTYDEGFEAVSGHYCTYVVGDDLPHPHMIEELVGALESTGSDFVYSDMNLVNDQGRIIRQMRMPDYNFEKCFAKWYHLGVSHLYRTEWHEIVGLMDESYLSANDYDHYLRFAMAGAKFYHLPKILYSIRYHGENRKTGQHTDAMYANLLEESKRCAWRARRLLCADEKQNMVL